MCFEIFCIIKYFKMVFIIILIYFWKYVEGDFRVLIFLKYVVGIFDILVICSIDILSFCYFNNM